MINKKNRFCICDFETTGIADESLPIEVGCIFTDHDFNVLSTYESLIKWDVVESLSANLRWPESMRRAYEIHNIEIHDIVQHGFIPSRVSSDITNICKFIQQDDRKVTMISDNAQFEWNYMKKLFEEREWPFHYSCWDTTLLLETTPIGDPRNVEHRAISDAAGLHRHIIRALEYNKYWG